MSNAASQSPKPRATGPVRIWDLPTRLFHWAFAALVVLAWLSGQFAGSDWRYWHMRFGYAALALLVFRLLWGFAGARYARFASFPPSLRAALGHWRAGSLAVAGHSAAGALSVYALLLSTGVQIVSGLMSADDYNEGPWVQFASERVTRFMGSVHALNRWVLLGLVVLHLAAIGWYALRGQPLVRAMLTGNRRDLPPTVVPAEDDAIARLRALVLAGLAAALAALIAFM